MITARMDSSARLIDIACILVRLLLAEHTKSVSWMKLVILFVTVPPDFSGILYRRVANNLQSLIVAQTEIAIKWQPVVRMSLGFSSAFQFVPNSLVQLIQSVWLLITLEAVNVCQASQGILMIEMVANLSSEVNVQRVQSAQNRKLAFVMKAS